jgi:hypothetical protein
MSAPVLNEIYTMGRIEELSNDPFKSMQHDNQNRWLMYNGSIKKIVKETIQKEFKKPETMHELIARLIPINMVQKIVNKLANVYNEAPLRIVSDRNESDQELVHLYESEMALNNKMKEANRFFKLFKSNLFEIVVTEKGVPNIRNLPKHTYKVWSHSKVCPEIPDTIMKWIKFDQDPKKARLVWWTDSQHFITDGAGKWLTNEMAAINNPDGINPFGTLPFVYTNSESFSVEPVPDDDLLRMSVVIPLILSDLAFAVKYLSWAVVYTVGAGDGDIPFSPSSIINLDFGPNGERPEVSTVSPEVDIPNVLAFVEFLVSTLLTTKNLSTSAISGQLDAGNPASGISKALDSAESQEDKKDQQSYFRKTENEFWEKVSKDLVPVWRANGMLNDDFNREFSSSFELDIIYREPKVIISERELIELESMKLSHGFTTRKRVLQALYPDMDDFGIEELMRELDEEEQARRDKMAESFGLAKDNQDKEEEEEEEEKEE